MPTQILILAFTAGLIGLVTLYQYVLWRNGASSRMVGALATHAVRHPKRRMEPIHRTGTEGDRPRIGDAGTTPGAESSQPCGWTAYGNGGRT